MNEEREHLLISRVVDGEADASCWHELEQLAQDKPLLWRELALAQQDHADLVRAMTLASARAEATNLPQHDAMAATTIDRMAGSIGNVAVDRASHPRLNRFGAWTGWAAAAIVAIIATLHHMQPPPAHRVSDVAPQVAGASLETAAQAFQAYLEKGREAGQVVGEVPTRVLIDTKPVVSGEGYEVIYLRQVMERTIVPDLYRFTGQDDTGRPILIRYEPAAPNSM